MAAVLYGRGQRDAGGVHELEPKRHNSGAAREAGGVEYLLAAGHRRLQRRAGGVTCWNPPKWTVVLIANPDCSTNSLPLLTVVPIAVPAEKIAEWHR